MEKEDYGDEWPSSLNVWDGARDAIRATGSPFTECRIGSRTAARLPVALIDPTYFFTGFSENISADGIFIATPRLLPIGARIDALVILDDSETPVRLAGQVRWLRRSTPLGMGVRFDPMSPDNRRRIETLLRCP